MKKFLTLFLVVIIGASGVYYTLYRLDNKDVVKASREKPAIEEKEVEVIPSKDDFVNEAVKLQTLAENINESDICKCYKTTDIDKNTSLKGSILVYTAGDTYVSNVWLSNGYYIIENSENIANGLLEDSAEEASIYCGEASADTKSKLCDLSQW